MFDSMNYIHNYTFSADEGNRSNKKDRNNDTKNNCTCHPEKKLTKTRQFYIKSYFCQ